MREVKPLEKMELSDFIKETILQIFEGISQTQLALIRQSDGIVNPLEDHDDPGNRSLNARLVLEQDIRAIQFDLAIEISNKKDAQGGLSVISGIINAGGKGGLEKKESTISRIQFEVPVVYPDHSVRGGRRKLEAIISKTEPGK